MEHQDVPGWAWALIAAGCCILMLGLLMLTCDPKPMDLNSRTVVITGGSSGIGKAAAQAALAKGANVAIMARRREVLEAAATELRTHRIRDDQRVSIHTCDVTNEQACKEAMEASAAEHGSIDMLICSAGLAFARRIEDTTAADFERLWRINFMGTRNSIMGALPFLKVSGLGKAGGSRIVMVSSAVSIVSIYGFSAYGASKFALMGLAQAMQQELRPWNIRVMLSNPPDTDTPLLAAENEDKPEITKLISDSGGLEKPELVSNHLLRASQQGEFFSGANLEMWALCLLGAGAAPAGTTMTGCCGTLLAPILNMVIQGLHLQWNGIIDKHAKDIRREYSPEALRSSAAGGNGPLLNSAGQAAAAASGKED